MSKYFGLINSLFRTYKKLADNYINENSDNAESVIVLYFLSKNFCINEIASRSMYSKSMIIFQCNYFAKRGLVALDYDKDDQIVVCITEAGLKFLNEYEQKLNECIQFNDKFYEQICDLENSLDKMMPNSQEVTKDFIYV